MLAIDNGDRLDLDQVAGGQRLHPHQGVGWLVIPEQCHPALFDRWQALVTPVTDDEDRYLSYLVRPGAGCSERTSQVGKYLAGLDSQITGTDEEWRGWWGEEPPFHTPVFVLTHHVRPSIEMKGGTTFHFIDASPAQALAAARQAAGGLDVRIGGGPATIRQFLAADLIDHMHVAIVPIVLGRGERVWDGLEAIEQRFNVESVSSPSGVTHLTFTR